MNDFDACRAWRWMPYTALLIECKPLYHNIFRSLSRGVPYGSVLHSSRLSDGKSGLWYIFCSSLGFFLLSMEFGKCRFLHYRLWFRITVRSGISMPGSQIASISPDRWGSLQHRIVVHFGLLG